MSGANLPVPVKRPVGRPKGSGSKYTQEIADEICERLASGETLRRICMYDREGYQRAKGEWPSYWTVYDWGDPASPTHIESFSPRFARANQIHERVILDECMDIADTPAPGVEEIQEHSAKNGVSLRRARKDMLGHRALQIDTRLKLLSRRNPQVWSERLQQPAKPGEQDGDNGPDRLIILGGLPAQPPYTPPPEEPEGGSSP